MAEEVVETAAQVEARQRMYQRTLLILGARITVGDGALVADVTNAHNKIEDVMPLAGFTLEGGRWTKRTAPSASVAKPEAIAAAVPGTTPEPAGTTQAPPPPQDPATAPTVRMPAPSASDTDPTQKTSKRSKG